MRTVAQVIIDTLEANGVGRAFCVPGESYLPLLDALHDSAKIDLVTCRHEGNAGYMALTEARLSGRPGVCLVSRGPGAMNAAIALHNAEQDCLPFLLLVGQVPRRNLRRNAFQEIDYGKAFTDIVKWSAEVTEPARIAEVLVRALHAAMSGTPGPVVLSLPEDMLDELVDLPDPPPFRRPAMQPSEPQVQAVSDLLARARRPLILAGGGLAAEGGREALLELAEAWKAPVIVTFRRQDLFPNAHTLYAGDLGLAVSPLQRSLFDDSDALVLIGAKLDDLTTQGYEFPAMPRARQAFAHVHDDPRHVGEHCAPDVAAICDPVAFARELAQAAPAASNIDPDWTRRLRDEQVRRCTWTDVSALDGVVFGNLVARLEPRLTANAVVVADAGLSAAMLYQYIRFTPPQQLLSTFVATMGCGVANAIAAALHYPDRQIVCVAGDGGFIMSSIELRLAIERRLPIRFIVSNNNSYGSIRREQEKAFPERVSGTTLSNPNLHDFARAFGCDYLRIDRDDQIEAALDQAFACEGPVLLEVCSSLSSIIPKPARALQADAR